MSARRTLTWLSLLAAMALLPGCVSRPAATSRILLPVPFVPQYGDHCGPASLEMLLRYHGISPDATNLAHRVHVPALGGTIPELIADAARSYGLKAQVHSGSYEQLVRWLHAGIPPIAYLPPVPPHAASAQQHPTAIGHFVVVTGLLPDRQIVRFHSGACSDFWYPIDYFMDRWRRDGCTAILIEPGEPSPPRAVPATERKPPPPAAASTAGSAAPASSGRTP